MLKGKVILVVGGAGLLGARIVRYCISQGASVVVADRDLVTAQSVVDSNPASSYAVQIEIASKDSVIAALTETSSRFGKVDGIVNTAYPRNSSYGRKFEEVEYADFNDNVGLHLGGYFLVSQQAALFMAKQGHGVILNMSSIYGIIAPRFEVYDGTPMTMPVEYAAIKAGLIHLTKYIAKYMKGRNVRINCLSLGGLLDKQPESFVQAYGSFALNKGMLEPEDIVGTIGFLLSDASQYMNGQNVVVDDGWTL